MRTDRDVDWWRVPAKCYGVWDKHISINIPLFNGKPPRTNIVLSLQKSDMPTELVGIIHLGMEFEVEVPVQALMPAEFIYRNFTWKTSTESATTMHKNPSVGDQ